MAMGTASFVLLIVLALFVIGYSSTVLAYAGHINQKGSADCKSNMAQTRVALLWISGIMLILAVVVIIVAAVQFARPSGVFGASI
jgi:hypothetical protein